MLKCIRCGEVFGEEETVYERVCWEDYYGVSSMFRNKNYGSIATCPCCGSEELEEYYDDDEEEEEDE